MLLALAKPTKISLEFFSCKGTKKEDALLAFNSPLIYLISFTHFFFYGGMRFSDVINTDVPLKNNREL